MTFLSGTARDKLICKSEAAEVLGVSMRTLERRAKYDPYFPKPWKRKHTVRFWMKEIEKYKTLMDIERHDI